LDEFFVDLGAGDAELMDLLGTGDGGSSATLDFFVEGDADTWRVALDGLALVGSFPERRLDRKKEKNRKKKKKGK
jgi:hypothetical protein